MSKVDEALARRRSSEANDASYNLEVKEAVHDALLAELIERGLSTKAIQAIRGHAITKSVSIYVGAPERRGDECELRIDFNEYSDSTPRDHGIIQNLARDLNLKHRHVRIREDVYGTKFRDLDMLARHVKQHLGANGADIPVGDGRKRQ